MSHTTYLSSTLPQRLHPCRSRPFLGTRKTRIPSLPRILLVIRVSRRHYVRIVRPFGTTRFPLLPSFLALNRREGESCQQARYVWPRSRTWNAVRLGGWMLSPVVGVYVAIGEVDVGHVRVDAAWGSNSKHNEAVPVG